MARDSYNSCNHAIFLQVLFFIHVQYNNTVLYLLFVDVDMFGQVYIGRALVIFST